MQIIIFLVNSFFERYDIKFMEIFSVFLGNRQLLIANY
jgi:hypothetical protein